MPLSDLLAYLGPELWLKKHIFQKDQKIAGSVICPWTVIIWQQLMPESYSNPLKTREAM